jgi:hypothetical protein
MAERSGTVVPIGSRGRRSQAGRRAVVRAALIDARSWIEAGLEGACSLEEAVASAVIALGPAHGEVLRNSLG